jgi:hypothetical protein
MTRASSRENETPARGMIVRALRHLLPGSPQPHAMPNEWGLQADQPLPQARAESPATAGLI